MVIGTALGFSDWGTVALSVALAFLFGYTLTSLPLLRAGLALGAVVPIALASDTLSIAVMEIVDNAIVLAVPGAMEAGLDSLLFWGSLSFALAVAGVVRAAGEPLADRARQGARGRARDRHPRRAVAARGRRDRGGGLRVRRRRAGRRAARRRRARARRGRDARRVDRPRLTHGPARPTVASA